MLDLGLRRCSVIVVDDEPANVEVLTRLLGRLGLDDVVSMTDPAGVVEIVARRAPDLLVLDLHMPHLDGLAVLGALELLRHGPRHFPVLMLTGDASVTARRRALGAGADDFLTKPFDAIEVGLRVEQLLRGHVQRRWLLDERAHLRAMVDEQVGEIERARAEILDRLALASEFRDDQTQRHAQRIGAASRLLAEQLGCSDHWASLLERAAPLHDVGKLGIPDAILLKPGRLTAEEFDVMKTHAAIGARILGGSTTELLELAEQIAVSHHERWDGSGYPGGLAGEHVPLCGRIVAVADVFDALRHERPYKAAWPVARARTFIGEHAGELFDPDVVAAFEAVDDRELLAPA